MQSSTLIFAAFLVAFAAVNAANEIKSLPGVQFDIKFKHYSGYLQVSKTHFLHYWFVESQNNPARDPLIFWFNGGPGCSSLDGLLNEMVHMKLIQMGKLCVQILMHGIPLLQ